MASQILGMPAGDAGSGAGDPPWRCGSEGEKGTRPLPASGVRRGRIRVPAPVRIAPGSGLTAVAGVPCELRLDGFGVGRKRDAFGEGEGPCNLSKSCFLGGFFFGNSIRRGVGSGGFDPGKRGDAGVAGRGARTAAVSTFLHYITSNLPQISVIKN